MIVSSALSSALIRILFEKESKMMDSGREAEF